MYFFDVCVTTACFGVRVPPCTSNVLLIIATTIKDKRSVYDNWLRQSTNQDTYRPTGWAKSMPAYCCNNFVYCQQTFVFLHVYTHHYHHHHHHHHRHHTTWLAWCKRTALQEHVIKSVWRVLSLSERTWEQICLQRDREQCDVRHCRDEVR